MRVLDFFDGFSSATEPVLQFIAAGKLASYADDASYESAKGSAGEESDLYWNTTIKAIRIHNGSLWTTLNANFPVEYEVPTGLINGLNQNFVLSNSPVSEKHVIPFINGIAVTPSEFSLVGATVTFDVAPEQGQELYIFYFYDGDSPVVLPPSGVLNVPVIEITAQMISDGYLTLGTTPIEPTKVQLTMLGVGLQVNGVDFQVIGNQVNWNGLGLEGFLDINDSFSFFYYS